MQVTMVHFCDESFFSLGTLYPNAYGDQYIDKFIN
jgi:hypothetical protein